ncbi:fimbrial protein [Mediterranea massiliensis]|uniref:fimbrial protein n=1 Tax=Mediterranea massiliensis TaxID=1841865 RepID=UPI0025A32AD6|nr:fimbrial protein [Mediterranea massiliensis]MDM8336719.1 fimbrial protein [Mediterranea massiliensis]
MTMKYTYNKLTILCVCLFLLLSVASCTDEEIGSRLPQDGELVEMTFILNVAQTEDVALTRAVTSENTVTELTLLVFPSQEGTAELEQIQRVSEFTKTNKSYRFTIQLEASASEKYIYIVANANNKLTGIEKGTTLASVRAITSNVVSEETNLVMSGVKQSAIPGIGLVAEDFVLNRNTAKVTVENAEGISLRLDEFQLRNGSEEGQILAGADATNAPRGTETIGQSDPTKPLYTYPSSSASQPFLVVSGTDNGVTSWYRINLKNAEGSYFSLLPNHHYEVTITKVNGKGYDSADEAAKHDPSGIEAEIYDHQPTVYNMITDGSQELGVSDTIEIGALAYATAEFSIKYYPGKPTDLKVEVDDASTSWLGLDNSKDYPKTETLNNTNDGNKETGTLYTYRAKTKIKNLSGDDRYGHILVSAGGLSRVVVVKQVEEFLNDQFGKISLTVKEYTRDDDWDVTSTTELGTYDNYWKFIRGKETDLTKKLYGITPEAMGGKIRTEGFHAPMSDFLQFVYTFTLPNETSSSAYSNVSWRVELAEGYKDKLLFWKGDSSPVGDGVTIDNASFLTGTSLNGQSFTFTNKLMDMQKPDGSIVTDAYRYGKDAFRIVLTNQTTGRTTTLSYDLYHTGVFDYDDGTGTHQTGTPNTQGWYYYEVIHMGNNYWLDRNLGAKSSGYYMQDGSGGSLLGNGDWPMRNNSAGGLYCVAGTPTNNEPNIYDDICPKGFRIPYMSEFNALVADPKFRNEYVVNTGVNYWSSHYLSDKGTVYFPKNRMYYGGQAAGDANAGYYWTRTAALGASGSERGYWLQFMKFSGSNASAGRYRICQGSDPSKRRNGMSVRCVYASRVVETSYNIKFYVKGYTHVFLYNDEGNGKRTFLNSWPGDMIAIYDSNSLAMYHTFAYSSVTEYNNLKVVFNIVDNSGKVTSYPTDYDTNGGVPFSRGQSDKFFDKDGNAWTAE